MLRITFVVGYAFILIGLITMVGIKVIALGENGSWGESPLTDYSRHIDNFLINPKNLVLIVSSIIGIIALWVYTLMKLAKRSSDWEKQWVKTLIIGCSIMMSFFLFLVLVGCLAHYSSGLLQESAAKLAGIMSSPLFMEASFLFIGVILLMTYNIIRRKLEGDDYVEMEIED